MKLARRRILRVAASLVVLPTVWRVALAQPYPARPVRVIIPFAPGAPTDLFARPLAQKLSESLGKQFYIENVGGAGGNLGMGQAAKAPPDGYTILIVSPSLAVNPSLYDKVPYDPLNDFAAVTLAVSTPIVLTTHPTLPVKTVQELVDLVRANPGKYSYASPGTGTPPHLLGELFRLSLGLDLVHVPFNGGGPAIGSAVAGHTPISFGGLPPAAPHITQGSLRALAIASKTRSRVLPEVPTMAESGYIDLEADGWWAVLVPAGTPASIVALLQREIVKAMALPDMQERLAALGYDVLASTPADCADRIKTEIARWSKVIRSAGIKAQ